MRYLVLLSLIFLFSYGAKAQPISYRSNNQITVFDYNLFTGNSFRLPVYKDTLAANAAYTLDSCGKVIYTYTGNQLWYRICNPKRWAKIPSSAISIRAVDTIYRTSGKDSIYFKIDGTTYSIKDSVGGGGGITRAVDTIYRNEGVDSIYFKINNILYSIKDSTGGGLTDTAIDGANSRRWSYFNNFQAPLSGAMTLRQGTLAILNPSIATSIRISRYDNTGADMNAWFTALDDYLNTNPGKAYLQLTNSFDNYRFGVYQVGNVSYTGGAIPYWTVGLTPISTSAPTYNFLLDQTTTVSWVLFGADGSPAAGAIDSIYKTNDSVFAIKNSVPVFQYLDSVPNLQKVTDAGNTTTNMLYTGNIIATDQGGGDAPFSGFYDINNSNSLISFEDISSGYVGIINTHPLTGSRGYTLPDTTGTLTLSVNGNFADTKGNITIPIDTTAPNLQQVTDAGNTTTNDIEINAKPGTSVFLGDGNALNYGTNYPIISLIDSNYGGYFQVYSKDDSPVMQLETNANCSLLNSSLSSFSSTANGGTIIDPSYFAFNKATSGLPSLPEYNFIKPINLDTAVNRNYYLPGTLSPDLNDTLATLRDIKAIPTGSGTVTSVATGYGLSGGTITTSGTLSVDTATLSQKYMKASDSAKYVPYVGAVADVDLGTNKISTQSLQVTGTSGNGHINLRHQSADATATGQSTALFANSSGDLKWKNDGNYYSTLKTQQTANRVYSFQNKSYTLGDSADISARLLISDTATMLSPYLRKVDTASLSSRIDAKIGGSGTNGSVSKFTASGTIGNATVDVDYLQQDMSLVAMQSMGSSIKGYNIGAPIPTALATAFTMTSQQLFVIAVYIPKSVTLTGVRWFQVVNGSFTANNYNGVALYTQSGGTLTLVDSSTRDGNCWQQGTNWRNKDFVTPYSASAGIYYIGILYSSSAQTTAPQIGTSGSTSGTYNANTLFDFTNNNRAGGTLASQTTLPTTQALSGTSTNGNRIGVYLY